MKKTIAKFGGLPHRLEFVDEIDEVRFYDDSISTIPEATIKAVESIDNVRTVLIGGMDRNIDYTVLVDYIRTRADVTFICMYSSGERIYHEVSDLENVIYVPELKEAVELAKKNTPKKSACVLSPAAASYGYFENFEDRGNKFKEYVEVY